jgi:DNA-binding transcriptional MerR regulator
MRIGELSARAAVNIQTIRFCEREKLLREPLRTSAGYRICAEADLERVKFIKQSQQLGFTLKEVKELMEIHESAKSFTDIARFRSKGWEKAFKIAKERLDIIDQKIQFLKVLRKPLAAVFDPSNRQKELICPASLLECPAPEHASRHSAHARKRAECPASRPRK